MGFFKKLWKKVKKKVSLKGALKTLKKYGGAIPVVGGAIAAGAGMAQKIGKFLPSRKGRGGANTVIPPQLPPSFGGMANTYTPPRFGGMGRLGLPPRFGGASNFLQPSLAVRPMNLKPNQIISPPKEEKKEEPKKGNANTLLALIGLGYFLK